MRFISSNRNNSKDKRGIAGALFKMSLNGKKPAEPTPEEKYQKIFDEKMSKMMEDLAMGKKKSFVLPGTKQDKPKEVSKHFKATMEMLARKKAQAALSKEKKKAQALEKKKWLDKRAKELKMQQELQMQQQKLMQQQADLEFQQQASQTASGSYFFGSNPDENKSGWW